MELANGHKRHKNGRKSFEAKMAHRSRVEKGVDRSTQTNCLRSVQHSERIDFCSQGDFGSGGTEHR